jgi:UDP-glucose 4-epimerase
MTENQPGRSAVINTAEDETAGRELPYALVTGAAGFIGSHVAKYLHESGMVQVIALDDLSSGSKLNLPPEVKLIEGSVTDTELLQKLFAQYRFRYVYHFAAYDAEGLSHFIRRFNYTNNIIGSMTVLNEAVKHEVDCFVFMSSIAVYGSSATPMREDQIPRPEDPYGIAKFAVELDLAAAANMFGLKHVIFRPHNVYGEYQNLGDPYRNVIGIFMNQILQGQPIRIFGDGHQQRAFSYIGDIVADIANSPFIAAAQNEIFNVGADSPSTINELARQVTEVMNSPNHPIEHLPARYEVKVAFSNHEKAARVFGQKTPTSLSDGLQRMAAWAKIAGARKGRPFGEVEVERNLPASWEQLLARDGRTPHVT